MTPAPAPRRCQAFDLAYGADPPSAWCEDPPEARVMVRAGATTGHRSWVVLEVCRHHAADLVADAESGAQLVVIENPARAVRVMRPARPRAAPA